MSLPLTEGRTAAQVVAPGSYVDVIATLKRGEKVESFPLVDDVLVVMVDAVLVPNDRGKVKLTLSFAVNREQALLLAAATRRECKLDVLLRGPGKRAETTKEEYKMRLKTLEDVRDIAPPPREKRKVIRLPEGMDMYAVAGVLGVGNEFPVPGDRVDLVATRPGDREPLPLLDDALVLAVTW